MFSLAGQWNLSSERTVEAYALTAIAVADAFIGCWHQTFTTNVLRPVTYIQRYIDPNWHPLLNTPPFPTYTSGHSTQSGAAATVLTDLFGPLSFTDTTHTTHNPGLGFPDRMFTNFLDAANEAAISRMYGGIHYAFDNQDGFNQGQCVGSIINTQIDFRE